MKLAIKSICVSNTEYEHEVYEFNFDENADLYSELLDNGDKKDVYELKNNFIDELGIYEGGYFIDYGGFLDEKIIGHIINTSFFKENNPIEVAITTGQLMNDDDWYRNNY